MTAFQLQLPFSPSCRAPLSPTFSLVLFSPLLLLSASFHTMPALLSCLKPFILSCTPPPSTPPALTRRHPSPLYISPNVEVPIATQALTSNGCVFPPFFSPPPSTLPNLAPPSIFPPHNPPLMSGKPVGIRVLLLIIAFTGIPHRLALPWGGMERQRVKEWKEEKSKVMSSLADMCTRQLLACREEQSWHMQLSAMSSK